MNVREYARKVSVPFIYVCFYKFVFHKNCFLLFSSKMKHKKRAKLSQKKNTIQFLRLIHNLSYLIVG